MKKPAAKKNRHNTRPITLKTPGGSKIVPLQQALELLNNQQVNNSWAAAADLASQVVNQLPGSDEARVKLYQALGHLEQFDQLEQQCSAHLKSQPRHLISLEYLALALRQQGRDAEALPFLNQAATLATTNSRLINTLGTLYKDLGDFDNARACFDKALALKPLSGKAWWNRSDLSSTPEKDIAELEKQLKRLPTDSRQRHYFHFALYRAYDFLADYEHAFQHLEQANVAKKAQIDYSSETELKRDHKLTDFFNSHYAELKNKLQSASLSDFAPIFIVGLPRSGTSLVEQILAAHSQVSGCGEIPTLPRATGEILERFAKGAVFPDCLKSISVHGMAQIGFRYQQLASSQLGEKNRITDKFLLNYKAAPLISLVLPKARIIHVQRNAMDVCFGCYRQLFDQGLGFTYDLEDLAKTWHSQQKIAEYWHKLIPEGYHLLNYEDLVITPEAEIKNLLAFCGLSEEEGCYQFHQSKQTVKTLSSTQVRQPVFTSGLNRWKPYEQWLQPLKDSLEEIENR